MMTSNAPTTTTSPISAEDVKPLTELISAAAIAEIEHWRGKYPPERKRPPIIAALKIVQKEHNNYLDETVMNALAVYLDVPPIAVYEVATFYTMYNLKPVGEHVISVCTNLSCMMCGAKDVVKQLTERLNIGLGETTADGKITLVEVECMAACGGAPMLEVGEVFHENLTPEKIDAILQTLGWEDNHG